MIGNFIAEYLANGANVPQEIVLQLLAKEIEKLELAPGILVDGFPRSMEQALEFERTIGAPKEVLYFYCPLVLLEQRLLERGKTSGRSDDNIDTIRMRFRTFKEESMDVIRYYQSKFQCVKVAFELIIGFIYR